MNQLFSDNGKQLQIKKYIIMETNRKDTVYNTKTKLFCKDK